MSLNWVIETHAQVKSTQDIIKGMADMGQPEGQVVQAAVQTAGRGRHGRVWESQEGNLFLSLLLRPSCKAQDVGQLSLIAGLSLVQAIENFVSDDVALTLKWPNDVLLNGEKCAGLLLETELTDNGAVRWVALGLGVNVASAPRGLGAAINEFSKEGILAEVLRDRFLKTMVNNYSDWLANGFHDLRQAWLSKAHKAGSPLTVKIGPQLEKGIFHDIDAYGNLRLKDAEHRLKTIGSGEVYLY